jgi:hypothetical protein
MFIPDAIFFEPKSYEYELGKRLLDNYKKQNIPMIVIENHNNIEQIKEEAKKYMEELMHKYFPNNCF